MLVFQNHLWKVFRGIPLRVDVAFINLGNPIEISIHELVITILTLINSTSSLKFGKLPDDDPKRRRPNIDLAKSHLNWNPETPLELGLQRTISYFRSRSN